jgi:hypothetical protein
VTAYVVQAENLYLITDNSRDFFQLVFIIRGKNQFHNQNLFCKNKNAAKFLLRKIQLPSSVYL